MFVFSYDNVKDIDNYYCKTIVKFKETGDRLWFIDQVSADEVKCIDVDGFELFIDLDEPYEVSYTIPGRVVYQTGQYAAMLWRIPQKQYKRGISEGNTCLAFLDKGAWKKQQLKLNALQQFVDKPAYQNPEWCFTDKKESYAINRYISVDKAGRLFVLHTPVGKVVPESKKVFVEYGMFMKEVKTAFPSWEVVYV